MTDFTIPEEAVEAALSTKMRRFTVEQMRSLRDHETAMAVAREMIAAALPVMFEQRAWLGRDTESGYERVFETEEEFAPHVGKDWFKASPLYAIKEPK
jgi:hypothetical protein